MSFFNEYPYRNITDLNLDWLINAIRTLRHDVDDFVTMNAIKYADPIDWNITTQYEKNTVVIDANTGVAYLSVAAVPAGVNITRPEYWTVIFDLSRFLTAGVSNLADSYEANLTYNATVETAAGGWVMWNGTLYEALNDIHIGDRYVIDSNIKKTTVEDFYNRLGVRITQEIADRIAADTTLQQNIDAEAQARQDADTTLQQNIDAEAQTRQGADTTLQHNIDAEAQSRQNADSTLQQNIDTEAQTRADSINAENAARNAEDARLQRAIDAIAADVGGTSNYKGDYFNVVKLGAKGDGSLHPLSEFYGSLDAARVDYPFVDSLNTSIDVAAIQKAVNSGLCFIPKGNYQINAPIVLPQSQNVSVIGEFRAGTYLTAVTSNIHIFDFNRVSGASIFDISNVTFIGGQNVTNVTAIYFHGLIDGDVRYEDNWLTCTNCYFYDLYRAFDLYACSNIYVDHCYATRVQIFAYLARAASFAHFSHILTLLGYATVFCDDERADGISNGLFLYDVIGVYNTALTFRVRGWQAVYIQNCSADFQGGTDGGYFLMDCQDATISGCWCAGTDVANSNGVRLWNSINVHVSDCTVEHFANGMRIDAKANCGVTVRDCVFIANSLGHVFIYSGSGCIINENTFKAGCTIAPLKGYENTNYNVATCNVFIGSAYDTTLGANSVVGSNIFS